MDKNKTLLPILLVGLFLPTLGACSQDNDVIYLRVLNSEDYIYIPEEEGEPDSMVDQFEAYCKEDLGLNVKVIYETFDTNETMLNTLKTGKAKYDLVCPSDYVIQKMIMQDMIEPFDFDKLPNYVDHCPEFLRNVFKDIKAADSQGVEHNVDEYAVGYMWGTLGILYNPAFKTFESRGYDVEEVMEDMTDWNILWDSKYKGTISIKDSMRDTYSVGIMRVYDEEFKELKEQYDAGQLTDEQYNKQLTAIFNRSDTETVSKVEKELLSLKDNIFGFEVDSGKEDINTGKIGINIAWSGDAVYAMDKGDGYGVEIYYSIPETGGNIWFDGWVMPKSSSLNKELAHEFLNFMSDPSNAQLNMYGVGYTPFIGGEEVLDYAKMLYDERAYYLYQYDEENDDWVYDDEGNYVPIEGREDLDWNSPEVIAYAEAQEIEPVDLSYMFDNTKGEGENFAADDMIFYPSEIGRQFSAQYPTSEEIKRLAVMQDFGENNKYILDMWENVKTNKLPVWAIILLVTEIVIAIGAIVYVLVSKKIKKDNRKRRLQANAK